MDDSRPLADLDHWEEDLLRRYPEPADTAHKPAAAFRDYAAEARKFARIKLADLSPSREPKLIAGIISGLRTQMTQRGRISIVTLDDNTVRLLRILN